MLRFSGFELELRIERVVARGGGPAHCWATDSSGDDWLVVQVDDNPDHLAWLCAPVSARALLAVLRRPAVAWDALRHSPTGTVELMVVDHGRAVSDRCLLSAGLPTCPPGLPHEADVRAA